MAETTASTGWGGTFSLSDLKRLKRDLDAMPKPEWTLIGPNGHVWRDTDPQVLLRVLAVACYPLVPGMYVPANPQEQSA